jgi:hypothetical protein
VLSVSTRFLTNSIVALAGGFLVVASQAFSSSTTGWLAFSIAIGTLVSVATAQLDQTRGRVQQALDGVLAIVSVWTIIASVVFHNRTLTWLSFAEALGLVAVAYAGVTYGEVKHWMAAKAGMEVGRSESLRAAA